MIVCRDGGIGRRKGLKILRDYIPCRFESGSRHQLLLLTSYDWLIAKQTLLGLI